jgi:hypothetical protein
MKNRLKSAAMAVLILLLLNLGVSLFESKMPQRGILCFKSRQQLIVLQRKVCGRIQFTNSYRLFFIQLYCWCPSVLNATEMLVAR